MDPIAELAEFDRETVAQAKAVEQQIQAEGFAAGHIIRDVRVFRVLMPWVGTKRWDGSAEGFTFAEFETDKGLVGIAEGANSDAEELKSKVLGKNPFDPHIRADMGLAYWDLIGKIANRPLGQYLHELFALETPLTERVPMSAYTWYSFPDLNGENAVTFESYPAYVQGIIRTHGFHNIKLSMCDFEPQRYVELVRNIRAAVGPDVDIRVDPHASWGEAQALRFMREVEDYHLEWIEEPVGGRFNHIFRAGHRLRLLSTIPISSHAWLPPLLPHLRCQGPLRRWDPRRGAGSGRAAAAGSQPTFPLPTRTRGRWRSSATTTRRALWAWGSACTALMSWDRQRRSACTSRPSPFPTKSPITSSGDGSAPFRPSRRTRSTRITTSGPTT